jgi:hypothetical protein
MHDHMNHIVQWISIAVAFFLKVNCCCIHIEKLDKLPYKSNLHSELCSISQKQRMSSALFNIAIDIANTLAKVKKKRINVILGAC